MNSAQAALPHHQNTLNRFLSACNSDPRVLAAFLYGSYARAAADKWSDLDIGVVTTDDAHDDFVAGREAFLRRLAEPLFVEDFDIPGVVFFILADGAEGELTIDRASDFAEPHGTWRALLDKAGVLAQAKPRPEPDLIAQTEILRRRIMWFWHDLSHFITAIGRGQLWWASGQLEALRRICLTLARLRHDYADGEADDDPSFKLDVALPAADLASLRATFVPQERGAMLAAARLLVDFFHATAQPLAEAHAIRYPIELERLMLDRLATL